MAVDKKNIIKMAYLYFQEGRWDKAIEEYRKLLELDPLDLKTHNMIADVYVKKGDIQQAFKEYVAVMEAYQKAGQADKATNIRKKIAGLDGKALDQVSNSMASLIKKSIEAEAAYSKKEMDKAVKLYEEIIKLEPDNPAHHSNLAEAYLSLNRTQEAVKSLLVVANAYMAARLSNKARDVYLRILEIDPMHLEARQNLAEISVRQGSDNDAKKYYLSIAQSYFDTGDHENAMQYAQKAIKLKSIEALHILGSIYTQKKMFKEAVRAYSELLRFKVDHADALKGMAAIMIEQGDLDGAVVSLGKAVKAAPDDVAVLEQLAETYVKKDALNDAAVQYSLIAEIYEAQNLFDKSQEYLKKVLRLDEGNVAIRGKLSDIFLKRGMSKEAARELVVLGDGQIKAGAPERAKEYYEKALIADSGNQVAKKQLEQVKKTLAETPPAAPAAAAVAAAPAAAQAPPAKSEVQPAVLEVTKLDIPDAPVAAKKEAVKPTIEFNQEFVMAVTMADTFLEKDMAAEALEYYQKAHNAMPGNEEIGAKINQLIEKIKVETQIEARRKAEEEIKRKIEEKARKQAEAEIAATARAAAEAEARKKKAAEELARRKAEEEAAGNKAEEEQDKKTIAAEKAKQKALEKAEAVALKTEAEAESKREDEATARENAAEMARRKGEEEETARTKKLEAEVADEEFMTVTVAEIYRRRGQGEKAAMILEKILKKQPRNAEAKRKLDQLRREMNKENIVHIPEREAEKAVKREKLEGGPPKAGKKKSKISFI